MKVNVGIGDRAIRIWIGLAMIFFAYMNPDLSYGFIGWFGFIPLVTGIVGWCGLYRLLNITTVKNA